MADSLDKYWVEHSAVLRVDWTVQKKVVWTEEKLDGKQAADLVYLKVLLMAAEMALRRADE